MSGQPVIVITGGSRGIGAATARLAAARGYKACINYAHDRQTAEQLATELHATAIQADLATEAGVVSLFEQVDAKLGRLSALVNNAATLETQTRLDSLDAPRIQRLFALNVQAPLLCAKEAVRRMSTRYNGPGGAIVNVSSGASKTGSPGEYIDYAATKGAIDTFTIGLAKEVAEEGIRVNAVRPGFIYTTMHAKGGEPNRVDRLKTQVPLQRGGQPEEVAAAILWLLSNEASYITGAILDVAGGR